MRNLLTDQCWLVLVCFVFCHVCPEVRGEKPNVILIMTDDQGYGDLSCHGNPVLKTPHLDRLYHESIRLTDFHVSSFCTPTRAALMTGRYPARTGAYRTSSGRTMMHPEERTMAHWFAELHMPQLGPLKQPPKLWRPSWI